MNACSRIGGHHGLIVVYKPRGMISKDVSRRLSRYLPRMKLGHVGTLDPAAEGVLPLLLGNATRVQDYLLELPKTYAFAVRLGEETDTLDLEGQLIRKAPYEHVLREELEKVIVGLRGTHVQAPPLYSAVKFQGKPLYEYARAGRGDEIDLASLARPVEVYESRFISYEAPVVRLEVTCSKGTYVRILAQEIAKAVGSCGTVVELKRTACAGASVENSRELAAIEEHLEREGDLSEDFFLPLDKMELGLPRLQVDEGSLVERLRFGQILRFPPEALHYDRDCHESNQIAPYRESSVLLLEEGGRAFGLGLATRLSADRVQVVMKRSLL